MTDKGAGVICPSCGIENLPGTLFCVQCGTYLPSGGPLRTESFPEQERVQARPWRSEEGAEREKALSIDLEIVNTGREMTLSLDSEILLWMLLMGFSLRWIWPPMAGWSTAFRAATRVFTCVRATASLRIWTARTAPFSTLNG